MTQIEQIYLSWLADAMTASAFNGRRYYYDSFNRRFFLLLVPDNPDGPIQCIDATGMAINGAYYQEIFLRLLSLSPETNGIMEMRRLSQKEKIDIQAEFIEKTGEEKYKFVTTCQPEHGVFILDVILQWRENEYMAELWKEFKLEAIRKYVDEFARNAGVDVDFFEHRF